MQQLLDLFHRIYDVQGIVRWGGLIALVAIIFAETGLLVGFFLPGDSLLVTAGIFCTSAVEGEAPLLNIVTVNLAVIAAAIVGDTVGYWIGAKSGPRLFTREQSLLFSKKHLLRTKEFYERHGGKTIIMARFMPFLRTFAPVVAGIGQMNYRRFLSYNVFGAIGWTLSMTLLGFTLGQVYPPITKQIDKLIIVIIVISLIPGAISWFSNRSKEKKAKRVGRGVMATKATKAESAKPAKPAAKPAKPGKVAVLKALLKPAKPAKPARSKVPFSKKNQPPSEAEFLARLPLPVGKKFETIRTYLKKQKDVAEDLYFYGPKTGWAYRYRFGPQSLATVMIHGDRLIGIVALDAATLSEVDFTALSEIGERARRLAHGSPALSWFDLPLDGTGAADFKVLLKAKLSNLPTPEATAPAAATQPLPPPPPPRRPRAR